MSVFLKCSTLNLKGPIFERVGFHVFCDQNPQSTEEFTLCSEAIVSLLAQLAVQIAGLPGGAFVFAQLAQELGTTGRKRILYII